MCLFKMPQENKIILFYRDCEHYDSLENEKGSTRDRREPLFKNMKTTKLRQCCQLLKCSIRYKGSPWTDQFNDFLGFMFSHWENTKLKHATLNTALFLQKALTLDHKDRERPMESLGHRDASSLLFFFFFCLTGSNDTFSGKAESRPCVRSCTRSTITIFYRTV